MKRTPLQRRSRLKPGHQLARARKGIAKRGRRAKREEKALNAFRAAVRLRCLQRGYGGLYKCERCLLIVTLEQFESHHKRSRAQGGEHDPEKNGAGLCDGPGTNDCHGRAHAGLLPDAKKWIYTRKPQGGSR